MYMCIKYNLGLGEGVVRWALTCLTSGLLWPAGMVSLTLNPESSNPTVASTPGYPSETYWSGEAVVHFKIIIFKRSCRRPKLSAAGHKQQDKEKAGD